VLELTYSNHRPQQSGPTTASWASDGALASVPSRADACAGRRARSDHSTCHQRVLPSWRAAHRDQRCLWRAGLLFSRRG
jgi:hypothetical protein